MINGKCIFVGQIPLSILKKEQCVSEIEK